MGHYRSWFRSLAGHNMRFLRDHTQRGLFIGLPFEGGTKGIAENAL